MGWAKDVIVRAMVSGPWKPFSLFSLFSPSLEIFEFFVSFLLNVSGLQGFSPVTNHCGLVQIDVSGNTARCRQGTRPTSFEGQRNTISPAKGMPWHWQQPAPPPVHFHWCSAGEPILKLQPSDPLDAIKIAWSSFFPKTASLPTLQEDLTLLSSALLIRCHPWRL